MAAQNASWTYFLRRSVMRSGSFHGFAVPHSGAIRAICPSAVTCSAGHESRSAYTHALDTSWSCPIVHMICPSARSSRIETRKAPCLASLETRRSTLVARVAFIGKSSMASRGVHYGRSMQTGRQWGGAYCLTVQGAQIAKQRSSEREFRNDFVESCLEDFWNIED